MRDPYLYEDVDVLKNLLDIKEASVLDCAEADYVSFRLKQLAIKPLSHHDSLPFSNVKILEVEKRNGLSYYKGL